MTSIAPITWNILFSIAEEVGLLCEIMRIPLLLGFLGLLMKPPYTFQYIIHDIEWNWMVDNLKETPFFRCFSELIDDFTSPFAVLNIFEINDRNLQVVNAIVLDWGW